MSKWIKGKKGFGRLMMGLLIVVLSTCLAYVSYNLYLFNHHLHLLGFHMKNLDRDGSETELNYLRSYYNDMTDMHLDYLADYLLRDMFLYEANIALLYEDYEKSITDLERYPNDFRAQYLSGVARFNVLHAAYQAAKTENNQEEMKNIIDLVMNDARPYFQECIKKSMGMEYSFDCAYNYDLTSDPEATQKALENLKPMPKYILDMKGLDIGDGPGEEPSQQDPLERDLDGKEPGTGNTKIRG